MNKEEQEIQETLKTLISILTSKTQTTGSTRSRATGEEAIILNRWMIWPKETLPLLETLNKYQSPWENLKQTLPITEIDRLQKLTDYRDQQINAISETITQQDKTELPLKEIIKEAIDKTHLPISLP